MAIIKDELNVMELRFGINELGTKMTKELLREGIKRELVRSINAMRKNAGLTIQDKIIVYWDVPKTDSAAALVRGVLTELGGELAKDVLANEIKEEHARAIDSGKEIKANGEDVWLGIKKIG